MREFVLDAVLSAGGNPCPPTVVGVGIGGSFDTVGALAKAALLRPLGEAHPDGYYARMETELLESINASGVGPQGLGGRTTGPGRTHKRRAHAHSHAARGRVHQLPRDKARGGDTVMEIMRLSAPLGAEEALSLRAGQRVLLSGTIYTARDAAHRRLCELLARGGEPPFPLEGAVIYYCGPAPAPPGRPIGAAGPTTSYRHGRLRPAPHGARACAA